MADENATVAALKAVREMFQTVADAPRRIEPVVVTGLGTVYVKGLTAQEYDDYESSCVQKEGDEFVRKPSRALLLRHCVVTQDGVKVFKDDQVEMLGSLDSRFVVPIAKKAMELCGLSESAEEDTAKN